MFVSCIQKCYPLKNFRASAPNPAGGAQRPPRPPPAKHLHSPLATPLQPNDSPFFLLHLTSPSLLHLETSSVFCFEAWECVLHFALHRATQAAGMVEDHFLLDVSGREFPRRNDNRGLAAAITAPMVRLFAMTAANSFLAVREVSARQDRSPLLSLNRALP